MANVAATQPLVATYWQAKALALFEDLGYVAPPAPVPVKMPPRGAGPLIRIPAENAVWENYLYRFVAGTALTEEVITTARDAVATYEMVLRNLARMLWRRIDPDSYDPITIPEGGIEVVISHPHADPLDHSIRVGIKLIVVYDSGWCKVPLPRPIRSIAPPLLTPL